MEAMIPESGDLDVHRATFAQGRSEAEGAVGELRGAHVPVVKPAEMRDRDDVARSILDGARCRRGNNRE